MTRTLAAVLALGTVSGLGCAPRWVAPDTSAAPAAAVVPVPLKCNEVWREATPQQVMACRLACNRDQLTLKGDESAQTMSQLMQRRRVSLRVEGQELLLLVAVRADGEYQCEPLVPGAAEFRGDRAGASLSFEAIHWGSHAPHRRNRRAPALVAGAPVLQHEG